jgi:hypothetical protein
MLRVSPDRRTHILYGDRRGGGHSPRSRKKGKSKFPYWLSDDEIIAGIEAIVNDPMAYPGGTIPASGRWEISGYIQGVPTLVVVHWSRREIITAYRL